MSQLEIEFEWEDPKGARGPELRATWSLLRIRVGGTVVTNVVDDLPVTAGDFRRLPIETARVRGGADLGGFEGQDYRDANP